VLPGQLSLVIERPDRDALVSTTRLFVARTFPRAQIDAIPVVQLRAAFGPMTISRRLFAGAAIAGVGLAALKTSARAPAVPSDDRGPGNASEQKPAENTAINGDHHVSDEIVKAKIRRALLSGPEIITREATVAEMDAQGKMTVLRPGTNHWVCVHRTPRLGSSTCSMGLYSAAIPTHSIGQALLFQLDRTG
jgi:hypothetical protein